LLPGQAGSERSKNGLLPSESYDVTSNNILLVLKGRASRVIDHLQFSSQMTKTELQTALAEATQTDKRTAGVFLDTLGALAYKEIKKNGEFVLEGV
jgi:hypothetical protein